MYLVPLTSPDDVNPPTSTSIPTPPSPPSGPMTCARAKALYEKVNSLLSTCDFGSTLDSILSHSDTLCILRYEPSSGQGAAVKIGQDWSCTREEGKEMVSNGQFGEQTGAAGPPAERAGAPAL